jgi:hypothetical protein
MTKACVSGAFVILFLGIIYTAIPLFAGISEDLAVMSAGTWHAIPNSTLSGTAIYNTGPVGGTEPAIGINVYSGGAFDTNGNRLMIYGGGHGDYFGNEMYAFNLDVSNPTRNYKWETLWEQSAKSVIETALNDRSANCTSGGTTSGYLSDGAELSNHTYQYNAYNPVWNAFISPAQGSVALNGACYNNSAHNNFNVFDLASYTWSHTHPPSPVGRDYNSITLVDSRGNVWVFQNAGNAYVYEYSLTDNAWHTRSTNPTSGVGSYAAFGAMDTSRNIAVIMGGGSITVWDVSNEASPRRVAVKANFTGPPGLINSSGAGLAWDSNLGLFVGWTGLTGETANVYVLKVDLKNKIYNFTNLQPNFSNTVTPIVRGGTSDGSIGPYNRWAYSPIQNIYILQDRIDRNVLVYKLTTLLTDNIAPTVTAFTAGSPTGTGPYTIPITSIAATDNDGNFITGYAITQTPVPPRAWSPSFTPTAPTSYSVNRKGVYDLYAWAQDAHGNVSRYVSTTIQVATTTKTVPGDFSKISDAIAWANSNGPGSIVQIDANGNPWQSWRANPGSGTTCRDKSTNFYDNVIGNITGSGITIRGVNGVAKLAWLCHDGLSNANDWNVSAGTASHGSMITMTSRVTDLRLENIEVTGVGTTGAGLWVEPFASGLLYIKNSKFHDNSYGGLLSGTTYDLDTVIVGSQFYDNSSYSQAVGQVHNIYIGESKSFTFFDSTSRESYGGQLLKSRSAKNYIYYSRLTDEAGGLCALQNHCSNINIDLPFGGESYIVGNLLEKSAKSLSNSYIQFNAEQRFRVYISNGGAGNGGNATGQNLTNTRTGHVWRVCDWATSAAYGYSGSWAAGTQTALLCMCRSDGSVASYYDATPLQTEFNNGDILTYTVGGLQSSVTVATMASEPNGRHLSWSYGDPTTNGFYLVNNTFINHYGVGQNSGAVATYVHYDSTYANAINNVFVDLQSTLGGTKPMFLSYWTGTPGVKVHIPTSETSDYWTTSDPGLTSVNSFDYSLTPAGASNVGVSTTVSDSNGMQLTPLYEYLDPASTSEREVLGCKGAYGYFSKPGSPSRLTLR